MAKEFDTVTFSLNQFIQEVGELQVWLQNNGQLSESADILPFFRGRPTLCSQLATLFPEITLPDRLAYEYDLFGDFKCDLVVGQIGVSNYCFVEFEDARQYSLFRRGANYQPYFGGRLEHGFSQLIDWLCKLDGQQRSVDMHNRFDYFEVKPHGLLIIGRDQFLNPVLQKRLDWRSEHVLVNSKRIYIYTLDAILEAMQNKVRVLTLLKQQ